MPPLTRRAARLLEGTDGDTKTLAMRTTTNLTDLAPEVWQHRNGVDVYSDSARAVVNTLHPEVDHVVEVQVLDTAIVNAVMSERAQLGSNATTFAAESLRDVFNAPDINFNVTSRTINRAKEGPFEALTNRFVARRLHDLRPRPLSQYVRTSQNVNVRRLHDLGHWDRIETAVVRAYEAAETRLDVIGATGAHWKGSELVEATMAELAQMLGTACIL